MGGRRRVGGAAGAAGLLGAIGDAVLEALSPTRCIACERPGKVICDACASRLARIDPAQACPRCSAPFGRTVCTECSRATALDWCVAAATFDGPAPDVVRGYKDAGERRLAPYIARVMADALAGALPYAPEGLGSLAAYDALTFVPATATAFRRRGFDHMEEVARLVSAFVGMPLADALAKRGRADQRRLGRAARAERSAGAYEAVLPVSGASMLLLDDVVTTGATMGEAARTLKLAGAVRVAGLAFARVW